MPHLNGSYSQLMRAILICPNENLRKEFEQAIAPHWMLNVSRTLDTYPSADDLRRVVRAWAPEIVFLNIESAAMAENISRVAGSRVPGYPAGGDSSLAGRFGAAAGFALTHDAVPGVSV